MAVEDRRVVVEFDTSKDADRVGSYSQALLASGYTTTTEDARRAISIVLDSLDRLPFYFIEGGRRRKRSLYYEGDPMVNVTILRDGCVFTRRGDSDQIIDLVDPISVLEDEVFSGAVEHRDRAGFLTDGIIQTIPKETFIRRMGENPDFGMFFSVSRSIRAENMRNRFADFMGRPVDQRIARSLLELIKRPTSLNGHEPTQRFLADFADCSRETCNKYLKRFSRRGIFDWRDFLHDPVNTGQVFQARLTDYYKRGMFF